MAYRTKALTAMLIIAAVVGSAGMAFAAGSNYNTAYVGNATEMGVNETQTYDTIQNATDNVAENGSVEIQSGTYNLSESVNVTESNVTYAAYSDNITIDASNTSDSYAFVGNGSDTVSVGENVTIEGNVYAGGGGGEISQSDLEETYYGVPLWGYLLGILALLGAAYKADSS